MTLVTCKIPAGLAHPFFYPFGELTLDLDSFQVWNSDAAFAVFPYELLASNGSDGFKPWENDRQALPDLFEKWNTNKLEAGQFFAERNVKKVERPMKEGLAIFISGLFWMNAQPVALSAWPASLTEISFKPVNAAERLDFILARPLLYHSYKQLSELMLELEKQYYKKIALQK
ncbi:hypothetical protein D0469_12040 [Peribacillus saganii]|uniref:YpoC-like domain-containing protein n=1 Tax=Peribacillus saganii TaxID=2303992 RepID=A0A372LNF8_9BACI|nr:hypothetical protein [Peribacillus saganii]RFU68462.1 hypothetical protein D0469_12040 [Peribacillus saganii]